MKLLGVRKERLIVLFIFTLIVVGSFFYWSAVKNTPFNHSVVKTLRYSFTLSNPGNARVGKTEFLAFAPVKRTATQEVVSLRASKKFELESDPYGNQVMRFQLHGLKPFQQEIITVTAQVKLFEKPRNSEWVKDGEAIFIEAEPYVEIDSPQLQEAALKVKAEYNNLSEGKGIRSLPYVIHNWVANHINYSGYLRDDFGAKYALEHARGDCTEYMYLAMALLRINQIPAVGVAGFPVRENAALLKAAAYHNWAFYKNRGRWRLMDPQRGFLDDRYQDYVAFRIFAYQDDVLSMSNSQRFLAFDSRLKVSMQ